MNNKLMMTMMMMMIDPELTMLLHRRRSDGSRSLTRWYDFSAWNDAMAAILKVRWPHLRQSMPICLKNINPGKFHPDPIWNDGASGFLRLSPQQTELYNKMR